MREPNPGTVKERLALIEEVLPSILLEIMTFRMVLELLFQEEAERADDAGVAPLDVLVFEQVEEVLAAIDPDSEETSGWLRGQAALGARHLLGFSDSAVDLEDFEGAEPPANDDE